MSDQPLSIEPANTGDIPGITEVLRRSKLPVEGVGEHLSGFLVTRSAEEIAGCVAVEKYGETGILRSLAVAPGFRDKNLGTRLAHALINHARNDGVRTMVLLTETAEGFFEKLGFEVVERSAVAPEARESWQFTGTVCQSATCMKLQLR